MINTIADGISRLPQADATNPVKTQYWKEAGQTRHATKAGPVVHMTRDSANKFAQDNNLTLLDL
jgi:hypothetical protein